MKLKDFIKKLQEFDPELTVVLADTEGCYYPDESQAEIIGVYTTQYYSKGDREPEQSVLVLGNPLP